VNVHIIPIMNRVNSRRVSPNPEQQRRNVNLQVAHQD